MQKLSLSQTLSQKLSPQQIQFIKLLQVPTVELESRIEAELEANPALEEGPDAPEGQADDFEQEESTNEELDISDYLHEDDYAGYKMQGDGQSPDEEDKQIPLASYNSLNDQLMTQLGYLRLSEREEIIARQLIGSIESDGYIRRDLEAIVNDLAFSQNIETNQDEVESVLFKIQDFDPPGIGARNLQECLQIQLEKRDLEVEEIQLAIRVVQECFDEFTRKHYDKIIKKLGIEEEDKLKSAIHIITHLNPKPGGGAGELVRTQYLMPDFIIKNRDGVLEVNLNARNAPELRVSRSYSEMLDTYDKSKSRDKKLKETATFVKQKLDSAKWFIDAIKQRQQTLLRSMQAILDFQYEFFLEGDESKLKPMILKDIANVINMDISTVSRVANSKAVQTEFGIFPLKYFFSEAITTDSGDDVSSREIKNQLKELVDKEDKRKPLSDEKIEKMLKDKGYSIARRTVAKYREQLDISVARLRKEL